MLLVIKKSESEGNEGKRGSERATSDESEWSRQSAAAAAAGKPDDERASGTRKATKKQHVREEEDDAKRCKMRRERGNGGTDAGAGATAGSRS